MSILGKRIAELYGDRILRKSALSIRDGAGVFEQVLGGGKFNHALEIGTFRGVAAAEMAQHCRKVTTIDLKQGQIERLGLQWDRREFWRSLEIENVDLRLVQDDDEKAKVIAELDFDFAFVDGAHDQRVRRDFEVVKHCGTVLFHDYGDRGAPHLNHVFDFVNTLPKHQVQRLDIFALWTDS